MNGKDNVFKNIDIKDDLIKFGKLNYFTGGKMILQQMDNMKQYKRKWSDEVTNNTDWRRWKHMSVS